MNQFPLTVRCLAAALIAVAVSGCGARGFKKDGASHDDFMTDYRQCMYEANTAPNRCYPGTGFCGRDEYRNACMERKGWSITRDQGNYQVPR
jgi:hypothetical protein